MLFQNSTHSQYLNISSKRNEIFGDKGYIDQYMSLLEYNTTSFMHVTRIFMSSDGQERDFRRYYSEVSSHTMVGHCHRNINFRHVLLYHVLHMSRDISKQHDRTARSMGSERVICWNYT